MPPAEEKKSRHQAPREEADSTFFHSSSVRRLTPYPQRFLLVMADVLAILVAFAVGGRLAAFINETLLGRLYLSLQPETVWSRSVETSMITAGLLFWLSIRGHYSRRTPFWAEMKDICQGLFVAALLDATILFLLQIQFSRLWFIQTWLWSAITLPFARIWIRRLLTTFGRWVVPVIVVGDEENSRDAVDALHSETYLGYRVVGVLPISSFVDSPAPSAGDNTSESVRRRRALIEMYAHYKVKFALLAPSASSLERMQPLLRDLNTTHAPYGIIPPLRGLSVLNMKAGYFFSHDVMMLSASNNLANLQSRFIKRAFDIVVSGTALLLLLPFFAVVALVIRLDGGSSFYGHRRVGIKNRLFGCLKFRTMVIDADARLEAVLKSDPVKAAEWQRDQKLRDDPRVTRVGRFLRATSLDELPQLINVLRGDMSLVGPRPVTPTELLKYGEDASYYLLTRPGITGLWQVSGRNDTGYERRVQLDCWYVRNWSLWQDIAIIFKTIPAVLMKSGAY
ncbi:MAG: undecaprenyl-phosphate galactose phosphotransferase WbaP [Parvibaculaceae bacterium]|nr:undecaprenyl-phosphate galactose phosphotransferase WbaP [Parvibaculaceae bacterium]